MFISKFGSVNGIPNENEVEEWTEGYFHTLLTIMNSFFIHVDVKEAVERMSAVPFENLVREELEGESNLVLDIAVRRVNDLAETELDFMRSYAEV